jgi:hypothetical protein
LFITQHNIGKRFLVKNYFKLFLGAMFLPGLRKICCNLSHSFIGNPFLIAAWNREWNYLAHANRKPRFPMNTIAEIEPLKAARALAFDLIFKEIKIFSRRADIPEERIALAELEREILTIEQRWRTAGMIDQEPELDEEPAA